MDNTRQRAFTLVELLVVIAVLALLITVAYPSYQSQILKIHRGDARRCLIGVAHQLERCYTAYRRYNHPDCASHLDCYKTPNQSLVPDGLTISASCWARTDKTSCADTSTNPETTEIRSYTITSIDPAGTETLAVDGESYTLYAIPQGTQAKDSPCALFRYGSSGARSALNAEGTDASASCW